MNAIKRHRVLAELSQSLLARRAGLHTNTIVRYEGRSGSYNTDVLKKIAGVLGCKISDLIDEEVKR